MSDVIVTQVDHSDIIIKCDQGIAQEISEEFSFFVDGYKFMPAYKNFSWDGKIRLFNYNYRTLPVGLLSELILFCKRESYSIDYDNVLWKSLDIVPAQIKKFCDTLNVHSGGNKIELRDYQLNAVYEGIKNKRRLLVAATGAGKSLILYAMIRLMQNITKKKILLLVPTVGLVHQMASDFQDYSSHDEWDAETNCHLIKAGSEKRSDKQIFISTWQSIQRMPKDYFKFSAIFVDEVHLATGTSIGKIVGNCTGAPYKIGLTGTLEDTKAHKMQLTGLFGKPVEIIKSKALMDRKELAMLSIKAIQLMYSYEYSKAAAGLTYAEETDWLATNDTRQEFLAQLAISQDKNALLLFNTIAQGDDLYSRIKAEVGERPVYMIKGSVKGSVREEIRLLMETHSNAILLGSYGTISTGFSVKNIHSITFCSSTKSKIRVLQSIGRGLRMNNTKTSVILYDVFDDMSMGKNGKPRQTKNYSLKHFIERALHYDKEHFDYSIKKIKLL